MGTLHYVHCSNCADYKLYVIFLPRKFEKISIHFDVDFWHNFQPIEMRFLFEKFDKKPGSDFHSLRDAIQS